MGRQTVHLLWTATGTLLGVYGSEHWARVQAERVDRENHPRERRLVWRHPQTGTTVGVRPAVVRRAAARSLAPQAEQLLYRITTEEIRP